MTDSINNCVIEHYKILINLVIGHTDADAPRIWFPGLEDYKEQYS